MEKKAEKFKTKLTLRGFEFPSRIIPAPMAGVSDRSFRDMLRACGCKFVYTEMVSSDGLTRGRNKTFEHMEITNEPHPYGVQIYGNKAETLAIAAEMSESYGADLIDLNLGCPKKKIVRNQMGSAMLQKIEYLPQVFSMIRRSVKLPFTVKMRAGFGSNPRAAFLIAKIAEGEGVDAICLHPRTREEFFSGHSDWNLIAELKATSSIPIIGNGDVRSPADALSMAEQTDCDAVMIGRGAMGSPWVYKNSSMLLEDGIVLENIKEPSFIELLDFVKLHYEITVGGKKEIIAIRQMRKHVMHYFKGFQGAKELRNRWMAAEKYNQVIEILNELKDKALNNEIIFSPYK